jgi:peptidoglycan/LPS O-acetylase OafA/YrhL
VYCSGTLRRRICPVSERLQRASTSNRRRRHYTRGNSANSECDPKPSDPKRYPGRGVCLLRYNPAIDGLRAIAILLVFFFHAGVLRGGWIGVDIFFVLSGYLITSLLIAENEKAGRISLQKFYIRRVQRLLPAMFVLVGVSVAVALFFKRDVHNNLVDAATALLYCQNYRYAFAPAEGTLIGHLWSLSLEEQFYLIWPLLLIVLLKFSRRTTYCILIPVIGILTLWRIYLLHTSPLPFYRNYFSFDTRADELLLGCLLALSKDQTAKLTSFVRFWPLPVIFLGIFALKVGLFGRLQPYADTVGFLLLAMLAAAVIFVLTAERKTILASLLALPPIVFLGRISYGFYLWHYMILREANSIGQPHKWVGAFIMSLGAAFLSYYLIELPFRGRKQVPTGSIDECAGR